MASPTADKRMANGQQSIAAIEIGICRCDHRGLVYGRYYFQHTERRLALSAD
jgi:hypothetical protein